MIINLVTHARSPACGAGALAAAPLFAHLRQGREAPRRVRAYNSAEIPWQLSISIVNTNTELAGMSAPMARPP